MQRYKATRTVKRRRLLAAKIRRIQKSLPDQMVLDPRTDQTVLPDVVKDPLSAPTTTTSTSQPTLISETTASSGDTETDENALPDDFTERGYNMKDEELQHLVEQRQHKIQCTKAYFRKRKIHSSN